MCVKSDAKIHRDYVRQLISAKDDARVQDGPGGVYKIKNNPRVTRIG